MKFKLPKGWEKDSEKLYVHDTGVRIQQSTYHGTEGWILIPTDLDQPVHQFEPTEEGRDKAFEAYKKGVLKPPPKKRKAAPKKKKKVEEQVAAAKAELAEEKEKEAAEEEIDDGSED